MNNALQTSEHDSSQRIILLALVVLSTLATIFLAASFLLGEHNRAYAADGSTGGKLAAQATSADYYAVLHSNGELVFQQSKHVDTEKTSFGIDAIYEGDLAGYGNADAIPWHSDVLQVRTVRFAEDFKELKPQSFRCWFDGCSNLESIDLTNLDASKSATMQKMFKDCSSLERIDGLEGFYTSSSTYFGSMFSGCSSLKSLDISHFDATHVEVLCFMFNGCSNLETLNMSGPGWKTPSLELMVHVWEGCSSLKSLDLSQLDTSHVRSMTYDFNGCSSLEYLDLSGADTSGVGNLTHLLDGCTSLVTIKVGPSFSFNGTAEERQFCFPAGAWKSSATGAVFAEKDVPNFEATTYTRIGDTIQDPEESNPSAESADKPSSETPLETAGAAAPQKIGGKAAAKGIAVGKTAKVTGNTYKVKSNRKATATFKKAAKNKTRVVVPASVVIKGKRYTVSGIARNAFKGTKAKTVVIKTKRLTKKSVKGCFKNASRLKTVKVPKTKKRLYKAIFAKANSGVTVRIQ